MTSQLRACILIRGHGLLLPILDSGLYQSLTEGTRQKDCVLSLLSPISVMVRYGRDLPNTIYTMRQITFIINPKNYQTWHYSK